MRETLVRSLGWEVPGEGHDNPLQYSCLENSMDRGAWWATVHGIAKSRTRLGITEGHGLEMRSQPWGWRTGQESMWTAIATHLNTSNKDGWWHLEPTWYISLDHYVCESVLISIIGFSHSPHSTMEKAMATHSSTLAWKIPWTEEPGRLQSGVAKSQTRLNDFTFTFHFHALGKEMATHSSVLAWRIPGTVEPGGLLSMRLHRVRHDWSNLAAAVATAPEEPGPVSVFMIANWATSDKQLQLSCFSFFFS